MSAKAGTIGDRRPGSAGYDFSDCLDYHITPLKSVMIIEWFEIIDVDVGNIEILPRKKSFIDLALDGFVAGQTGQRIGSFSKCQIYIGDGADETINIYDTVIKSVEGNTDIIHPHIHLLQLNCLS